MNIMQILSIFINFVYIQDQKLNINKLGNVTNTVLIILQKKTFVSISYSFWRVSIWSMKIVSFQGEAICAEGPWYNNEQVDSPVIPF